MLDIQSFPGTSVTKCHRIHGLIEEQKKQKQNILSLSSGGWKSKTELWTALVPTASLEEASSSSSHRFWVASDLQCPLVCRHITTVSTTAKEARDIQ